MARDQTITNTGTCITLCSISVLSLFAVFPQMKAIFNLHMYEFIKKTYSKIAKNVLPTLYQLIGTSTSKCPHNSCQESLKGITLQPIEVYSNMVTRVLACNPGNFTLHGTNTYLVGSGKSRILIDTGEGKMEYISLLKKAMFEINCTSISAILITHRHYDHLGGIHSLYKEFGYKIPTYKCLRNSKYFNNMELNEDRWKDYEFHDNDLSTRNDGIDWIHISNYQTFKLSLNDDDKEEKEIGGILTAIYTPGHCDDHVCFLLESSDHRRSMFVGDNVLGLGTSWFENLSDYVSSLQLMLTICKDGGIKNNDDDEVDTCNINRVKSPIDVLFTGHGPIVKSGAVNKIEEYILHRQEREDQVRENIACDFI